MSSTHAFEMRFTKKEYLSKKPVKFLELFYEYAPTQHYYTRVRRTRYVIEKLKTLCRSILIRCSTEIKTRQFFTEFLLHWPYKKELYGKVTDLIITGYSRQSIPTQICIHAVSVVSGISEIP